MMQMSLQHRKRRTDLENELMVAGGGEEEWIGREFGMDRHTWLYLKWMTKDLRYNTRNSAPC